MSFELPFALLGLISLPFLWWLHRRTSRPPTVELPSLMFLMDEDEARALPKGRRLDLELLATLGAATLLTLAAAGPRIDQTSTARRVRVVIDRGAMPASTPYAQRVNRYLASLKRELATDDKIERVNVPAHSIDRRGVKQSVSKRALPETLRGIALAGEADVRLVVSDLVPASNVPRTSESGDVKWVALGDARDANVGIVSVSTEASKREAQEGRNVFVNVLNDSDSKRSLKVVLKSNQTDRNTASTEMDVPAGKQRAASLWLPGRSEDHIVSLVEENGSKIQDAVPGDNDVHLVVRRPLVVHLSTNLGEQAQGAFRAALVASLRDQWTAVSTSDRTSEPADLAILSADESASKAAALTLVFGLPPNAQSTRLPRRAWFQQLDHPLLRDVPLRALPTSAWIVSDPTLMADSITLARWRTKQRVLPVATFSQPSTMRLALDLQTSDASVFESPCIPLLIDNAARWLRGATTGGPYEVHGLLDRASSRLGRESSGARPKQLAAIAGAARRKIVELRWMLLLGALALMLVLWLLPFAHRKRIEARQAIQGA